MTVIHRSTHCLVQARLSNLFATHRDTNWCSSLARKTYSYKVLPKFCDLYRVILNCVYSLLVSNACQDTVHYVTRVVTRNRTFVCSLYIYIHSSVGDLSRHVDDIYICMYLHVCIYIYIYTHTHIDMYSFVGPLSRHMDEWQATLRQLFWYWLHFSALFSIFSEFGARSYVIQRRVECRWVATHTGRMYSIRYVFFTGDFFWTIFFESVLLIFVWNAFWNAPVPGA